MCYSHKKISESEVAEIKNLIKGIDESGAVHGSSTKTEYIYHPIPFPEFNDINVHKNNACKKEFQEILKFCNKRGIVPKYVLDLGAHVGYFSFMISNAFPECKVHAVEMGQPQGVILQKLASGYGYRNITFSNDRIDEFLKKNATTFDTILMLNVHMWILKQSGFKNTDLILKTLKDRCRHLFFQTAHKETEGAFKVDFMHHEDDLDYYLKGVGFNSIYRIHTSKADSENKHRILYYASKNYELF